MNLPNTLTLSRIFIVPLLVVVLLTETTNSDILAVCFLLGGALTDWLDGYMARRRNQVTTLGKLLDPIADKLLISAAFISLVQTVLVPAWMVVIIIGREFAVSGLRNIAATEGFTIDASGLGKSKMVSQVIAISLLVLGERFGGAVYTLGRFALWIVVAFAILSMVEYFVIFWHQIDERIKNRERRRLGLMQRRVKT